MFRSIEIKPIIFEGFASVISFLLRCLLFTVITSTATSQQQQKYQPHSLDEFRNNPQKSICELSACKRHLIKIVHARCVYVRFDIRKTEGNVTFAMDNRKFISRANNFLDSHK